MNRCIMILVVLGVCTQVYAVATPSDLLQLLRIATNNGEERLSFNALTEPYGGGKKAARALLQKGKELTAELNTAQRIEAAHIAKERELAESRARELEKQLSSLHYQTCEARCPDNSHRLNALEHENTKLRKKIERYKTHVKKLNEEVERWRGVAQQLATLQKSQQEPTAQTAMALTELDDEP